VYTNTKPSPAACPQHSAAGGNEGHQSRGAPTLNASGTRSGTACLGLSAWFSVRPNPALTLNG
jgi:hypothetical protein